MESRFLVVKVTAEGNTLGPGQREQEEPEGVGQNLSSARLMVWYTCRGRVWGFRSSVLVLCL